MPKENTHLWFARTLIAAPGAANDHGLPWNEQLFFFLGAIIPDTFYYHPRARARRMPRVLHGSDPEWAGKTPFWFVHQAGRFDSPRDKAFVLGYLSHLVLDQIFHPVVHVLSGKRSRQTASSENIARHWLVETALDRIVNQTCLFHRILQPRLGDRIQFLQSLAAQVGLGDNEVRRALIIQHLVNRLILGRGMHKMLTLLGRLPLLDLSALRNLCYAQLDQEPAFAAHTNAGGSGNPAQDKALRAVRRIKWSRLFAASRENALTMFRACATYWRGEMPEDALVDALPKRACD